MSRHRQAAGERRSAAGRALGSCHGCTIRTPRKRAPVTLSRWGAVLGRMICIDKTKVLKVISGQSLNAVILLFMISIFAS